MSADGSTPIAGLAGTIEDMAAEIAQLDARLGAFTAPDVDEENRLGSEVWDRVAAIAELRPRNAHEAIALLAIAESDVRHLDQCCDYHHERSHKIVAHVLDWLEIDAGVTADQVGLGVCTDSSNRHGGLIYTAEEIDARQRRRHDEGYLAAVRRFAPLYYRSVQRELASARFGGPVEEVLAGREVIGFGHMEPDGRMMMTNAADGAPINKN